MKNLLFLVFCTSFFTNIYAQDIIFLKSIQDVSKSEAKSIADKLTLDYSGYHYKETFEEKEFIRFRYIQTGKEDLLIVFSCLQNNKYSFSTIAGNKSDIHTIWKKYFNPNHQMGVFSSDDYIKNKDNGLEFRFYVTSESATIKDFS